MARYLDQDAAEADGFEISHHRDEQRFVLTHNGAEVGEAHYSLRGEAGINFDHTMVIPAFRGTGLSSLLAHRAVTDEVVQGRSVAASCWFIDKYLAEHPKLLEPPR